MKHIDRYFLKHNIEITHILSAFCRGKNLVICLDSGKEISCTMQLYELVERLPEDEFVMIRRGTILRKSGILSIDNNGTYTMIDGRTFQGRKRYLKEHKELRETLGLNSSDTYTDPLQKQSPVPLSFLEKCSLLDDMPLAYCVIELVFDENGHGIDFIFRYCNKQMEVVENTPLDEMIDQSFYAVFKNGDRKWLITYADIALNGGQRTLHDYSPEINKTLTIYCYQPQPGYCACVLVPDVSSSDMIKKELCF